LNCDWGDYKANKEFKIFLDEHDGKILVEDCFSHKKFFIEKDLITFDKDAHYYSHDRVSALKAWRDLIQLGFDYEFANQVYNLIYLHMSIPFKSQEITKKQMKKMIDAVGVDGIRQLAVLRMADLYAKDCKEKQIDDLIRKLLNYEIF